MNERCSEVDNVSHAILLSGFERCNDIRKKFLPPISCSCHLCISLSRCRSLDGIDLSWAESVDDKVGHKSSLPSAYQMQMIAQQSLRARVTDMSQHEHEYRKSKSKLLSTVKLRHVSILMIGRR